MPASDLCTLEPGLSDAARRVHHGEDRDGEPICVRKQRAGVGRQLVGEHRDDPVHQVDARAPLEGLQVHFVFGADEVGDIRDMNADLPRVVSERPDGQRVIVVLGVRRIDSEYMEVPPICTMLSGVFPPVGHGVSCRRSHAVGKGQRQPVVMHHGQDVDARITGLPQHRLDAAHRPHLATSERSDAGHYDITLRSCRLVPLSHQYLAGYSAISGVNDPEGAGPAKSAHYGFVRSVQNLDHTANGAAAARAPLHTDHHLVAVHRGLQGEAGHEDILPTLVWCNEGVALLGDGDASRDEVDFLRHRKALPFDPVETPLLEHASEEKPKIPKIPWRYPEPLRDLLRLHRAPAGLAEIFQYRVLGWNLYLPGHLSA